MNRKVFLSLTFLALLAAGGYHWHVTRARAEIAAEARQLGSEVAAERENVAALTRDLGDAQRERDRLAHARLPSPTAVVPPAAPASAASDPALQRLRVQALVSDLRLRYAGVLRRAGFDAEKFLAFDRIQTEFLQVFLDKSQDDATRTQARTARDEQLRELFGDAHAQWLEANRNEPAHTAVMQIVQQTFSDAGAITTAQVDELTRVFAAYRTPPTPHADERYDWEPILAEARTRLTPPQQAAFAAAVELRRATEKMSALARKP